MTKPSECELQGRKFVEPSLEELPQRNTVFANYSFEGAQKNSITVEKGDELVVLEISETGWAYVQQVSSEKAGWVPHWIAAGTVEPRLMQGSKAGNQQDVNTDAESITLEICTISGDRVAAISVTTQTQIHDVKLALAENSKTPVCYQDLSTPDGRFLSDHDLVGAARTLCLVRKVPEANSLVRACRDVSIDAQNGRLELQYVFENGNFDVNVTLAEDENPSEAYRMSEYGSLHGAPFYGTTLEYLGLGLSNATALHYAAKNGLEEVCDFLICDEKFTQINAKATLIADGIVEEGDFRITAVHVAILSGHPNIACKILQSNRFTEVNDSYNCGYMNHRRSAFGSAALLGQPEVCKMLLQSTQFTGLNYVDDYDVTVLMLAASRGTPANAEVCRLILEDGRFTRLNSSSCTGGQSLRWNGNALHFAARSGLTEICQILLERTDFEDECINQQERDGTALQIAARAGHAETCKALLRSNRFHAINARLEDHKTSSDWVKFSHPRSPAPKVTALDLAERGGLEDVCNLIRSHPGFKEGGEEDGEPSPAHVLPPKELASALQKLSGGYHGNV